MNCFAGILAQAAPPTTGQPQQVTGLPALFNSPLLMMGLMGVIFYFILIRPQQQRAKQQTRMLSALKAGDKVVTASGIIAVVISVKDKTVNIRSADAKLEVTKASIAEIIETGNTNEA